ncbi:MAG: hypothetical protein NTW03_14970 [Verrucomicrobia bacterium]|nr:hypothetical protein [Verrucomicrobiota bacterium]
MNSESNSVPSLSKPVCGRRFTDQPSSFMPLLTGQPGNVGAAHATRWLVVLLVLNLALIAETHTATQPYDLGQMGGTSMGGKCPFEGAFFNKGKLPNKPMASQAGARAVKFAFRSELGWYAIAYYPQDRPKSGMKEYGRFTLASVDRNHHIYVITLFDPDYKGAYLARVPNPSHPKDLNGKKKVATIELQARGKELIATVKDANSDQVSFSTGDTFQMAPGK